MVSDHGTPSEHWSIIFNTFVMMQCFNEFNARKLQRAKKLKVDPWEHCVFVGVLSNPTFLVIVVGTFLVQICLVQWWYSVFTLLPLSMSQWIVCIAFGAGSLIVQLFINFAVVIYDSINPEAEVQLVAYSGNGNKVSPLDTDVSRVKSGTVSGERKKSGVLGPKRHNKGVDDHSGKTREIENKLSGMGQLQLMNSNRRKHSEHPVHAEYSVDEEEEK